jgi:hypothetical protein
MTEGDLWRKVRMTPELMQQMAEAAAGRGVLIEWGEPDEEGFYIPAVTWVSSLKVNGVEQEPNWQPGGTL